MDELRLVRREDRSLIVATETGDEYRLIVDDTVLSELRALSRREAGPRKASPREIQALVRAGKSRAEIAEQLDIEEIDVERYEEPVLAERRYILDQARAVAVRTIGADEEEQQFGNVIAERLIGLSAVDVEWSSWRDEEAGWMIGLEFVSHDVSHRAVWSFDHRKSALSPITSDATNLSKQGDVGDRLIPKLRAVDDHHRSEKFDSGAFAPEDLIDESASSDDREAVDPTVSGPVAPDHPSTGSIPIIDPDFEDERRRMVEERAVKSVEPELPDLGQTADLLDALRRRRGERNAERTPLRPEASEIDEADEITPPVKLPSALADEPDAALIDEAEIEQPEPAPGSTERQADEPRRSRNRPQIPSWDDILFGTRSEEDPS